jgi:hypothetical protein
MKIMLLAAKKRQNSMLLFPLFIITRADCRFLIILTLWAFYTHSKAIIVNPSIGQISTLGAGHGRAYFIIFHTLPIDHRHKKFAQAIPAAFSSLGTS